MTRHRFLPARTRRRFLPAVLAAALVLGGCGVPVDREPRDPEPARDDYVSGGPAPDGFGPSVERLYLVRDDTLIRVVRRVPAPRTPEQMIRDLIAGPTRAEQADNLFSALSTMDVRAVRVVQRRATVELGPQPDQGARNDEAIAYAQIVCTLTSTGAEVGTVSFVRDGRPLAVPRGDNVLSTAPLTIADYANYLDP